MGPERGHFLAIPAAAALLLWPALWNGYPIVFSDTGTYLSQAIHHYAGWDRPVFYSLFLLPLHGTLTLWPVIAAQALINAWVLWVTCSAVLTRVPAVAFVAGIGALSAGTWLSWMVCEIMPDVFTPLVVLVIALLGWMPERLSRGSRVVLVALAAFMIATQQSSLALSMGLAVLRGGVGIWRGQRAEGVRGFDRLLVLLPPAIAVVGLCGVNLAAHGRFAVSPFGNIFLLARVIYDGPGIATLRRDCPEAGWRLCPLLDALPATSDQFLWMPDSPLYAGGGPKMVSGEAGAIIQAAVLSDPLGELRAALGNSFEQLVRFGSGDGLEAWPAQVSPWIERDFPAAEFAAYGAARQQGGGLAVAAPLALLHQVVGLFGVVGCLILLPVALTRRAGCSGLLIAVLVALPLSAAITGALSAPHERYQSRIMWLPPFAAMLSLAALRQSAR